MENLKAEIKKLKATGDLVGLRELMNKIVEFADEIDDYLIDNEPEPEE
jgi:hypothetical protein